MVSDILLYPSTLRFPEREQTSVILLSDILPYIEVEIVVAGLQAYPLCGCTVFRPGLYVVANISWIYRSARQFARRD